jgi:hypothetical protein
METHIHTQQEASPAGSVSDDCVEYFSVANRVVVVTGSNRGNGFAIANGLRHVGAQVVRIDLAFDNKLDTDDVVFDLSDRMGIKTY